MPFCPKCRYEYRPDIKKCPDCDVPVVDVLPPEPEGPEWVDLVTVATFMFEPQAQEARLKLDSQGIHAMISNEKMAQMDIALVFADRGVGVMVRREDAARAREVLEG